LEANLLEDSVLAGSVSSSHRHGTTLTESSHCMFCYKTLSYIICFLKDF